MDEFRGIQTALSLMLLLQFTGAATGQSFLSLAVRDGDEVTLPCNNERDDQNNCNRTKWVYTDSSSRPAELVRDGQIDKQAEVKSDRLSVTENCSLVIKKVTKKDDVGRYDCRRIRSGQELGPDATVVLYVVTMTEQKNSDEVTLTCSVSPFGQCRYTVKWLFQGLDLDKDNRDLNTSQSLCSASVTFRTSHYNHTSSYQSLKCNVTDRFTGTPQPQLFPFRLSGEDTTTESPTPESPKSESTPESPTTESPTTTSGNSTAAGNQTQRDENMADPEGGVSYASVSYTKKTSSKAQVLVKGDDDEGDAVTYSTVKASSSSSASANPSDLYATVNKPNK